MWVGDPSSSGSQPLAVCPTCAPGVATKAPPPRNMHVIHAMLAPGQIDAMPSQREGQGFESLSSTSLISPLTRAFVLLAGGQDCSCISRACPGFAVVELLGPGVPRPRRSGLASRAPPNARSCSVVPARVFTVHAQLRSDRKRGWWRSFGSAFVQCRGPSVVCHATSPCHSKARCRRGMSGSPIGS